LSSYLVLPIVQAALSLALLPIVLKGNTRSAIHRLFFLYLLGLLAWGILIFFMRSSPTTEHALGWDRWLVGMGSLLALIFYHFSVRFTGASIRKWILPSLYGFCAILFILTRTDLLITGVQVKPYGYAPIAGPLFPILGLGFVFLIMALITLLKFSRTTPYADERNRTAYIITGLVISMVGGAFDLLPLLGLPLYPGVIIGNIVFCLLTTVAIVKYQLLDIRIVIRRGTAYFLVSATLIIPYVVIVFLPYYLFGQTLPMWANFLVLLLIAFMLWPLWGRIQRTVDRWFYRQRYDFLKALQGFSQQAHSISDLNQLGTSLVKLVETALQASSVYLLLRSSLGAFTVNASIARGSSDVSLGKNHPLVQYIESSETLLHGRDLPNIPELQSLTVKDRKEMESIGAEIFVPIVIKEVGLVGIVALGQKLSQQPYSTEDEQLMITVASRMAVELENARLYALEKTARVELERQNAEKTEFLHNVSHELKTPLTAIIASSELLEERISVSGIDYGDQLTGNILRAALNMDSRVSELLDFAKMHAGKIELRLRPVQIGSVIADLTSQLITIFSSKKQSLELDIPDSLPLVKADSERLDQILSNLLSNASKFSPHGTSIAVRVKARDNSVLVQVHDSAPAIAEEEKTKLFDPYYRGEDASRRARVPGIGLGLALCKQLVELHHGTIWVETKPGGGNIFSFALPIWQEDESTEQITV